MLTLQLVDETATLSLGAQIATYCPQQQFSIFLEGELGAGKTTLVRGLLHKLGHQGKVKSPTYTLVERYETTDKIIYHFDLYRVLDPEELDYLGLDDYFQDHNLCLIEWAQQGENHLPTPDIELKLIYDGKQRIAQLTPSSAQGKTLCLKLDK